MSRYVLPAAIVALLLTAVLCAQDKPREAAPKSDAPAATTQPAPPHAGFEKLKQLAGQWFSADAPDKPKVIYKVTSAGSVVQETLLPGTPHEMVTMYYQEGPDLVLVHYCALGNQPRMKAAPSSAPDKLEFKFAGGSNIDPAKDAHMHELTLTFVDADHLQAAWTSYSNGQASGTETFELMRKR
jgi:hypothetical protein